MKKESVYIETSIISYLCSRPSRDLIVAANQEITREWWDSRRGDYDLYVSEYVIDEISQGDRDASRQRLDLLVGIPVLVPGEDVVSLADKVMVETGLPGKVVADIAHICAAAVHGVDYLLTLNCAHIANPHWQGKLGRAIQSHGYELPRICVPQALWEGDLK